MNVENESLSVCTWGQSSSLRTPEMFLATTEGSDNVVHYQPEFGIRTSPKDPKFHVNSSLVNSRDNQQGCLVLFHMRRITGR